MKRALSILFVLALVFAVSPAIAGDINQGGILSPVVNSPASNSEATATGGAGGNAEVNSIIIDTDITSNRLDQDQEQGQIQGQSQRTNQANKQKTVITIEDKIQHVPVGSPVRTPDPMSAPDTELSNDVWWLPRSVSMSQAKAIVPNIQGYRWRVKNMLFKKGKEERVLKVTRKGDIREFMGFLYMKGSTSVTGIEVGAILSQIAMENGGKYYRIKKKGMQTKSGFINGQLGIIGSGSIAGSTQVGGSVGPTMSMGRSGQKGKPFMTIEVYR